MVVRMCHYVVASIQQTKVYQHSCHNTNEAYTKLAKSKEKVDAAKGARRKKALEKDLEVIIVRMLNLIKNTTDGPIASTFFC